ncbi:ATP-binding protein [Eubacterium limosum]|uniref:histidine kinase n=1 Tax=Eubacterium limosum TaxID=1736 RepID=A0ABT5UUD1_EUBLI|nr:ATP-binding protein [Eubacterium limosum]MCB6571825.1 cell wall metabolism sensor histidine kinase WalK [Eubacterium limosum]MDE1472574.1 ATP-binding protein [Eubacterium limosum]
MQMTYRGRMIVYNIALFIATFIIVIFCVIQGVTYYYINQAKDKLGVMSQDAVLYIGQELKASSSEAANETRYIDNSLAFSKSIAQLENSRVILFDAAGNAIADSVSIPDNQFLSNEIELSRQKDSPVMTLKNIDNASVLYYVSPIEIDNNFLGYVGFIYSLDNMDSFLSLCTLLFVIGGILGLTILVVVTLSFSKHFVQPIKDLTRISSEINKGNYNVMVHYSRDDEIGDLTQVFNKMSQNVNNVILQLESERKRLASVLASLDDGLLAIDKKGNIITSNSYIKTYFNISNPKTIYDFQYQSFLRDMFDDLKNGKDHISEEIDCNGRNLLIIGSPIREAGYEENYMIIIRNVTATKQFQNEQKKFISSVSHELRTPLTTIIGYTDMLTRRQVVDPEILNRSLSTINREGHRLLRLVDDLLNVNQFDKIEFDVKKANLDLHALLIDVVDQMQIKSGQNDIEINYKSDENLPEVLGDYDRLQQLFINVLHNAIKYSDKGDIIDVVSTREDGNIVVSIRDYGVGISDVEKDRIFNAFYRVDEDRARSEGEGGAGLGLYLVKQIVEKHNGTIRVDSQVGEGTNVIVTLPVIEKALAGGEENEKE